ncbi:MAG: heterodisulfide reductase-related iron-sulfur binding cluster [Alphaproteobacteria bacterium]|nr:heterodisulfide reductase-related iron-sulfur binding cluster [Alphaproteobacteria bacterium]
MKKMLETGETPSAKVVGHIDRCLSCLACMTTYPSSVHYMHLVDLARKRIAETFRRPFVDRAVGALLLAVMPSRFGRAVRLARLARPLAGILPGPLGRMARMVPSTRAGRPLPDGVVCPAEGERRWRVAPLAEAAAAVAERACDISDLLQRIGLSGTSPPEPLSVAYRSACALQHGQNVQAGRVDLLREAGFAVSLPAEGHLCCGSAGTYNILQPALADKLHDRKTAHLEALGADVIAAGNIGCKVQLEGVTQTPIVHTVQLLDWAYGGAETARSYDQK